MQFDDSDEEAEGDEGMEEEVKEEGSDVEDEGGVEAVFEETLKARHVEDEEVCGRIVFLFFFILSP